MPRTPAGSLREEHASRRACLVTAGHRAVNRTTPRQSPRGSKPQRTSPRAPTAAASGAYVFRPNSSTVFPVASAAVTELAPGAVVSEARVVYAPWLSVVFRLWANATDVDVEWTVGPIPIADGLG